MSLNDPSRIGPNQDINDPTDIIQTQTTFQETSIAIYNILNEPVLDIKIPVLLENGNTVQVGSGNINDNPMWSGAIINTYIDLAEKFRDYWNDLNNLLGTLPNETGIIVDFISAYSGNPIIFSDILASRTIEYRKYIMEHNCYTQQDLVATPHEPLDEPIWSGIGPTFYNSGTYPQLIQAAIDIKPVLVGTSGGTFLGCDNLQLEQYELYGRFRVTGSGVFGNTIIDEPELFIDANCGLARGSIFASPNYSANSDDLLILNPYNEPITISYSSNASLSITALTTNRAGNPRPTSFSSLSAVSDCGIDVRATGINSASGIPSWPPIHFDDDFNSSLDNSNPTLVNLNSSISNSFILGAQQKCIILLWSRCAIDCGQIIVEGGDASLLTDFSSYNIDASVDSSIIASGYNFNHFVSRDISS